MQHFIPSYYIDLDFNLYSVTAVNVMSLSNSKFVQS